MTMTAPSWWARALHPASPRRQLLPKVTWHCKWSGRTLNNLATLKGVQHKDPHLDYRSHALGCRPWYRRGAHQKRVQEPTGDPPIYSQQFPPVLPRPLNWEEQSFNTRAGPWDTHRQICEAGPLPHAICKTQLQIKHPSIRAKTTTPRKKT